MNTHLPDRTPDPGHVPSLAAVIARLRSAAADGAARLDDDTESRKAIAEDLLAEVITAADHLTRITTDTSPEAQP